MKRFILTSVITIRIIFGIEPGDPISVNENVHGAIPLSLGKRGDYPYPTNPTNDRAIGYLLKGKIKSTILNYGDFIDIDVDRDGSWDKQPAGLWGDYAYIPQCGFLCGVPGQAYTYKYTWTLQDYSTYLYDVWTSQDAYNAWVDLTPVGNDYDTNYVFVGVIFETIDDDGKIGIQKGNIQDISGKNQYVLDHEYHQVVVSVAVGGDPNLSNAYGDPGSKKGIGFIYPWALRPKLESRNSQVDYDFYDYSGCDGWEDDWSGCDNLDYYGANVAESWLTRSFKTDWQPSTLARVNTHNLDVTAGDIFGDTQFTDPNDPYPLLAHSDYPQTWPKMLDEDTGEEEPFWPGWWAEDYNTYLPGCTGTRKDPKCWEEVPGTFISDSDIYMEFDDRWAHRGNQVNSTGTAYEQKGYPMGIRVMAEAHSYSVAFAEDILFVTVKVRNESGDWYDENGIFHDAMIMPDGTKLNGGKGFNYEGMFLGFYFDADAYSQTITGSTSGRTNDDDSMENYDSTVVFDNDQLIISMAMIYDYDGVSGSASGSDLGIVGVQLLDTPLATDTLYRAIHGIDRLPGQKLKITDWHWFNWWNRPGVLYPGIEPPRANNKEEIQYKLMSGDTTNLSENEQAWFFHTANPAVDIVTQPHFDSVDGIKEEDDFKNGEEGLDCVLIASTGPFDLDVGEEAPFSFTVIFGEDKEDLIKNAEFAQIMYNSHYQGYTPPTTPTVTATVDHNKVVLHWDTAAENSKDVVTKYSDFEGYKVYKSTDGGKTWGDPEDIIYDDNGRQVGWRPIAQYDLTAEEDSLHCIFENSECSDEMGNRRRVISGPDLLAPWINMGNDSGLQHTFIDTNVIDGIEYTYSVTAYDMGVEPDYIIEWVDLGNGTYRQDTTWSFSNPKHHDGYQSIECGKGSTVHDRNYVVVVPGYRSTNITLLELEDIDNIIIPNNNTIGSGSISASIVEYENLSDALIRIEVQADLLNDTFEGYATENPTLFIFEVTDTTDQYPAFWDKMFDDDTLSISEIDSVMDLPGADSMHYNSDSIVIYLPDYKIEEHPIKYNDDLGYRNNWSDIFDGIRFRFDNSLRYYPLDRNVPIFEKSSYPDTNLHDRIEIKLQYPNQESIFLNRPSYSYKIEFRDTPFEITDSTVADTVCEDFPDFTLLPFRIMNLTKGKYVPLTHVDDNGDCFWEFNEEIQFRKDSVTTRNNPELHEEYTFNLIIDFDIDDLNVSYNEWSEDSIYIPGDVVKYGGMLWEATEDIPAGIKPTAWFDYDGDSINDNPWRVLYPWEDGDYVIIKPARWYVNGDSWIADLSILSKSHKVTQDELEEIKVVPNPYIVHSGYNEGVFLSKLRFTHLPQKCRITIYTINGEKVISLDHDNEYDGNEWWDLRTINNQEVAPGLYIYLVEAEGLTHIGKFAVVR